MRLTAINPEFYELFRNYTLGLAERSLHTFNSARLLRCSPITCVSLRGPSYAGLKKAQHTLSVSSPALLTLPFHSPYLSEAEKLLANHRIPT